MIEHSVSQLSLPFFADRGLVVQRHAGQISSDAGLPAIRQLDPRLRYTERLIAGLADERREPRHTQLEMLRQRLYGILADYEDCNDHDTLRDDPVFKLIANPRGESSSRSPANGRTGRTTSRSRAAPARCPPARDPTANPRRAVGGKGVLCAAHQSEPPKSHPSTPTHIPHPTQSLPVNNPG